MGINCVRLDDSTERALAYLSVQLGKSKSDIIRDAIDFFLISMLMADEKQKAVLLSILQSQPADRQGLEKPR